MRISEAVEALKTLNQDDHIIIAWWDNEAWPEVSKGEWPRLCYEVEYRDGWYEHLTILVEEFIDGKTEFASNPHFELLFDPQTAGGLLASIPETAAESCLQELRQCGYTHATAIGRIAGSGAEQPTIVLR